MRRLQWQARVVDVASRRLGGIGRWSRVRCLDPERAALRERGRDAFVLDALIEQHQRERVRIHRSCDPPRRRGRQSLGRGSHHNAAHRILKQPPRHDARALGEARAEVHAAQQAIVVDRKR